jgi:superfamily II DNA/RNA helicase
LPIANHLKQQEVDEGGILTQSLKPRALVITLNKELALQTRNVGKGIGHHCKMKIDALNLGRSLREEAEIIENGVDILVSTYKRLTGFL